jgi:cytochrome c biogenesis protein CcmG/thiol:disulfide interchange protein DsbE
MNKANLFLGGAVLFAAVVLLTRTRATSSGEHLTPFAVVSPSGDSLRSADLAGRVLLVNVWASWCAPCREELPELDSLAAGYDSSRVTFVALSDDVDGAAAREFLAVFRGMPHLRVGLGLGRLKSLYRYPGLPFTLLVDPAGRIVRTWYGYGGPPQWAAIDSTIRRMAPGSRQPSAVGRQRPPL